MKPLNRRELLVMAGAMSASAVWADGQPERSPTATRERRDLYPQGVASGDPDSSSVLLRTRRPTRDATKLLLRVEVSKNEEFTRIIASAKAAVSVTSDWTCRVLVGNLQPSRFYWYRFVDDDGNASRIGRTRTAPLEHADSPVRFAFVSCQNINLGEQHAYRRMIFEDERASKADQLSFILHLGDFIYENVYYPEDRPQGVYGRRLRNVVRLPHGEKIGTFHVPTSLEDYRSLYRAYLEDPDLQDARARWPFICIWDNHEFSQSGWQSMLLFNGANRPGQRRKLAANQAWFEYQPARINKSSGSDNEQFDPPRVEDAPIERFDSYGFGDEPNNRAAVDSLKAYRAFRWGRHLDLILTDQRSYRSEDPTGRPEAKAFTSADFPQMFPQEALEILDAGNTYAGGKPPEKIPLGGKDILNFRKDCAPQTILGAKQKKWFLGRLKESGATWKVWGCSMGTLEYRFDPHNLPPDLVESWPGAGYASVANHDHSTAYVERAEIYKQIRDEKITGFATVCGDRHGFWAGLAASSLPPQPFEPVGIAFITGSISAPGLVETLEQTIATDHPLRSLYLGRQSGGNTVAPVINMLLQHGVKSCLEYQQSGSFDSALLQSHPNLAPHLSFLDCGGHGYATVRVSSDRFECEFVGIPRPVERIDDATGGPLLYRVLHRTPIWRGGQGPKLEQHVIEGDPYARFCLKHKG